MLKSYPERLQLKVHKCPKCGERIEGVTLKRSGDEIDAVCPNQACAFVVELFWIHEYSPYSRN